jgi:hypothetical protein
MERTQASEPLEKREVNGEDDMTGDERRQEAAQEEDKILDVPFGLAGAGFLCNVLQYALFLGLTMVVLIIIRVFMPLMMPVP